MPGTTEPSCTTAQAVVKSSIDILNVPGVQVRVVEKWGK
jgi:hypothetical protein